MCLSQASSVKHLHKSFNTCVSDRTCACVHIHYICKYIYIYIYTHTYITYITVCFCVCPECVCMRRQRAFKPGFGFTAKYASFTGLVNDLHMRRKVFHQHSVRGGQ